MNGIPNGIISTAAGTRSADLHRIRSFVQRIIYDINFEGTLIQICNIKRNLAAGVFAG